MDVWHNVYAPLFMPILILKYMKQKSTNLTLLLILNASLILCHQIGVGSYEPHRQTFTKRTLAYIQLGNTLKKIMGCQETYQYLIFIVLVIYVRYLPIQKYDPKTYKFEELGLVLLFKSQP